jgi:hypothetical protein
VVIQAPTGREPQGSSARFDHQTDAGARTQATMELDARRIVPRPWQPLLRALIVRPFLHAINDDGAPDGTRSG